MWGLAVEPGKLSAAGVGNAARLDPDLDLSEVAFLGFVDHVAQEANRHFGLLPDVDRVSILKGDIEPDIACFLADVLVIELRKAVGVLAQGVACYLGGSLLVGDPLTFKVGERVDRDISSAFSLRRFLRNAT